MKTSELTGAALDWAVAKCEGLLAFGWEDDMGLLRIVLESRDTEYYVPTINWSQGGPIIEREKIEVQVDEYSFGWRSCIPHFDGEDEEYSYGPTPLIAAMRCYVASKLGDNIDIPEELK